MDGPQVRCGAELVALAEDYYQRMFRWTIDLHFVIVFFAVVATALRQGQNHPEWTLITLGIVTAVAGWTRLHLRDAYSVLRNPRLLLSGAAVFAVLLLVDDPLNSPLWWVGLAVLLVPAVTGDLRCNCACAAILTLGYAAGVVAHDHIDLALHNPDLALKASGFGFWSLLLHGKINRTARFFMRWDRATPDGRLPPLRVRDSTQATTSPADDAPPRLLTGPSPSSEARRLQVIMLLCDGHSERDIAECLEISARQVQRHVSTAKKILGAKTTPQLVLLAVQGGLVPR